LDSSQPQPNTDAEQYVRKRFSHKQVKHVGDTLRPATIDGFMKGMHIVFQPGQSKGLNATYHFRFTGREPGECTVVIRDQKIEARPGNTGECDLRVTADSKKWMQFLRKEASIVWLLMTFRVRLKGNPVLLVKFGKCFP